MTRRRKKRFPRLPGLPAQPGSPQSTGPPALPPPAGPARDLQVEIDLLRELVQRVHTQAGVLDDVDELSKVMDRIGRASARLADLVKTQQALRAAAETQAGEEGALAAMLDEVIGEVRQRGELARQKTAPRPPGGAPHGRD